MFDWGSCLSKVSQYYKQSWTMTGREQYNKEKPEHFHMYGIAKCQADPNYKLSSLFGELERKEVGQRAVRTDLIILTLIAFAVWFHRQFISQDKKRHHRLYFETKQFSVMIKNLPEFTVEDEFKLKS